MNVYEMYAENGNQAGFLIVRNTWGNTVARVESIGGQTDGPLSGKPPYHGNPEVIATFYTWKDGKGQIIRDKVSSPGTYSYSMLDPSKVFEAYPFLKEVMA